MDTSRNFTASWVNLMSSGVSVFIQACQFAGAVLLTAAIYTRRPALRAG
jgi:hypothetical protein